MKKIYPIFLFALLLFTACEEETAEPKYDIPSTYNFENVSYTGQTERLAMLQEMKSYMKTGNEGETLDAARLKAMFANEDAANFDGTYAKQIKSKTQENQRDVFEAMMDKIAEASQSDQPAAVGQAGVAVSNNGEKSYLLAENGIEYAQLIEKGLMGATFYYQATSVYMGDGKMNVDNEMVTPGEGTEMEHHWDEAFGYLGVPREFPVVTDGTVFWGKYTNGRNALLNTNERLANALIKGRAAISNDDLNTRDEAIEEAREAWELVAAATAIHYLNSTVKNFDDLSLKAHALSEAIAFTYSLKFNEGKSADNAQIDEWLTTMAGDTDFLQMNIHDITVADLNAAKQSMAKAFDLEAEMEEL